MDSSSPHSLPPNGPCDGAFDPSFVRRPSNPTTDNMRAYRRALAWQIRIKPTTETMLREALTVYDIENGSDALSPDVLSALEHLLELEGIQWPSDRERMYMLGSKVSSALKKLLRTYGYGRFATYGENHKGRLRIMPAPGKEPPALPDWLQIPYLVPVEGVEFRIIPDGCINPGIQPGHPLRAKADGSETHNATVVGTLGTIMTSGNTYVALTAGHIMNDLERIMIVKGSSDESVIELEIAKQSVRVNGRPIGRRHEPADFRDDCAFLKINPRDIGRFDHRIPCLNAHFFEFLEASKERPGDPLSTPRRKSLDDHILRNRLVVFKQGASSDLTMGFFEAILDEPPEDWYESNKGHGEEDEKDEEEWIGCVRWISEDSPFADPGDSGSLVFAREDGIMIPLGIHIGSPSSMPFCSLFISIDTFCLEAEKEGWTLVFTER